MLFSHVKISSFRELTWYFIGVYIIFIINKRTDTHTKKKLAKYDLLNIKHTLITGKT